MEFLSMLFVLLTLLYSTCSAADFRRHTITEESAKDEYIVNIPQDFEFPPLSSSDSPRRFKILSGADKVAIKSNGDVHTSKKLDRETICPENPPECKIDVEIAVLGNGFQLKKIQLILEDLNDNSPKFPYEVIENAISESASIGTIIRLDSAVDPDLDTNSIQRYEMSGMIARGVEESKNVAASDFPFALNVFRNIDGTMIPELNVTKALDREKVSSYELVLAAIDGGTPVQTGTSTVLISVIDANDNKPFFSKPAFVVPVSESTRPGQAIIQLEASDRDHGPNAAIEYSFSSSVSEQDRKIFSIDRYTGIISISNKLDYENKTIHHLTVEATDSRDNPKTAYATVTVQVLDVNDEAPQITISYLNAVERPDVDDDSSDGQPKPVLIRENTMIGDVIAFVTVTDKDTGVSGNVSCRLKDSSSFLMETEGTNRYLIKTKIDLDREVKRFHNIEIDASDSGSPPLSSTKTIVVELFDENDNSPTFIKQTYHLTVSETVKPGEKIAILTAEDLDYGVNAEITYSAQPQPLTAQVPFAIKPKTGAVYFKEGSTPLDAEIESKPFQLLVTATDNGVPRRNTSTILVITVADENDNSPKFKRQSRVFRIREDSKAGFYIGTVSAYDDDVDKTTNGKILYKFAQGTSVFSIDADTGQIYFVGDSSDLDREVRFSQPYVLTVIATDRGDVPLTGRCNVDIYIVDINDNSPVITTPNVTTDIFFLHISGRTQRSSRLWLNVKKRRSLLTSHRTNNTKSLLLKNYLRIGSTASSEIRSPRSLPVVITKVEADDLDEGENGRVRFSIEEGNLYNYFSIDPQSGNISLNIKTVKSLRKMHRGCHVIKINAKDLGKPVQQSFGWANIYVTDELPGIVNTTKAMKHCMNNSFYPPEFLPPGDNLGLGFVNLYVIIIIISAAVVLLLLACIVCVLVRKKCCNKKSKSYDCKNTSVSCNDGRCHDEMTYHTKGHKDSTLQMDSNGGDNRSSYCIEWASAQEKEELMRDDGDPSNESIRSHNSGKDSGTGDSMPSDAFHAASMIYRKPYANQFYRQIYSNQFHPSHVNMPPQDDVATTDEERRSYVSSHSMIGPKCTSECRIKGHGDQCWMPDSLQRASTRMTSFKGGEDYEGGSLKKRSMTPNSYQRHLDNMRYVPYYFGPVQNGANVIRGDFGSFAEDEQPGAQHTGHYQPHGSHISQPPYTQSPIPFNTVSPTPYSSAQQVRGGQYINLQGATYEANGVGNDEMRRSTSSKRGGNQYQNCPIAQNPTQQFYSSESNYHVQYAPNYQPYGGDINKQRGYCDEQGQFYGAERAAANEFAATNLLMSPADSEPSEYTRRLEQQITQHQPEHLSSYERGAEAENQRLLKSGNLSSIPGEDDSSMAKLSTIREEMDADEVVADIDRLLL